MADEDDPAVTLGERQPVEGAPLARVSARLMWGIETSAVREREGDTVVRTPEGPRELGAVLDAVDEPYFATRQEFETAVRDVIGTGPVPTADSGDSDDADPAAADGDAAGESDVGETGAASDTAD